LQFLNCSIFWYLCLGLQERRE